MDDEAAAADVAGVGQHHLEGESDRHGGVDGVAAQLQDVHADLCRQGMRRDDHGVGGRDGPRA